MPHASATASSRVVEARRRDVSRFSPFRRRPGDAVLRLPAGTDETAVARAASERGIGIHPMSPYRLGAADHPPQLVLGFGNLTEATIRRGIATIGDLLGA